MLEVIRGSVDPSLLRRRSVYTELRTIETVHSLLESKINVSLEGSADTYGPIARLTSSALRSSSGDSKVDTYCENAQRQCFNQHPAMIR